MNYIGDFNNGATVRLHFTTHAANGSLVAPSSAFASSDFRIYKDGSATEKTTTNGITVTSPFDSVTGRHLIVIDTSNNTGDTGFFAAGSDYRVELNSAKTVDGQVQSGVVIGTFSILNRSVNLGTNAPANWINAAAIASAAITLAKFGAGAIDSTVLAANAIGASQIATGAITNAKFAAGAVDATAIAANAITSAKVATGAITTATFAAGAINAAAIATDALTAAKFAASSLNGKGDWATAGAAMALTSGERDTLAGVVDARLLDAGDATDLIASIVTRVGNTNIDQSAFVAAVKAALFDSSSAANKLAVDSLGRVAAVTNADKAGYELTSSANTAIAAAVKGSLCDSSTVANDYKFAIDVNGYVGAHVKSIQDNAITSTKITAGAMTAIAAAVWNKSKSDHTTSGTFGALLDAAISSISSGGGGGSSVSAADIYTYFTSSSRADAFKATGFAVPGDAMALTSGERDTLAGAVDARLLDAGDATDLIASIVSRIDNTNVDQAAFVAAVKAALFDSSSSGNKLAVDSSGRVSTIVDATSVRTAIGLTSANLGSQLSDTKNAVESVKTKTDQLVFTVENRVDSNALSLSPALADALADTVASAVGANVRTAAYALLVNRQFLTNGEIRVKQRDDYSASDGRAWEIQVTKPGVDFTSATVVAGAGLQPGAPSINPTASLTNKTVGSCTLRLEFTSSQLNVAPGTYLWDAHILLSGRRNTVVDGVIIVESKYADSP